MKHITWFRRSLARWFIAKALDKKYSLVDASWKLGPLKTPFGQNPGCYFSKSLFSFRWFSKVRSVAAHAKRVKSDDHDQNQTYLLLSPFLNYLRLDTEFVTTYGGITTADYFIRKHHLSQLSLLLAMVCKFLFQFRHTLALRTKVRRQERMYKICTLFQFVSTLSLEKHYKYWQCRNLN